MVNKGKYWILEKNKGVPVSFWKILKGFFQIEYSNFEGYKGINKGNQCSIEKILSTFDQLRIVLLLSTHTALKS